MMSDDRIHTEPDSARAALAAYEPLAPAYDDLTANYRHEEWLGELERLALQHGLRGRRVLDVACGTGKSFAPLLKRGYEVCACDLSPRMVALARDRLAGTAGRAFVADMRTLRPAGAFDLVTCLDDAVNYLLELRDLEAALRSMAGTLRPGGVLLFDINTLRTYRTTFAADTVSERGRRLFCWRGGGSGASHPGSLNTATVEVFTRAETDRWVRSTSHHRQRHYPRTLVEHALRRAGLDLRAVRGQLPGGRLSLASDEKRHSKLVFLSRRREGVS